MQRTAREGMNNFLGYKSVPLPQHPYSHNGAERFTYFHLASTIRRPPQRPSGGISRTSPRSTSDKVCYVAQARHARAGWTRRV
jgi:hypothetical protein